MNKDTREIERRELVTELRAVVADGAPKKISGYAAVFEQYSDDLGGFVEKIRRGAFKKTLQEADVRALINHDALYVLGRSKAGTLRLWEDEVGLGFEIIPPNTTFANDLMESIGRGDVTQMSFGFQAIRDEWRQTELGTERELIELVLLDVSPVTFPAYPQTSAQVRSKVKELQGQKAPDQPNNPDEQAAPIQEDHPASGADDKAQARLAKMRRQLEIAEKEI